MDIILPFPLNHPSLLLTGSCLRVSAKTVVKVSWHENVFTFWQYLATIIAVATLFHVSWALKILFGVLCIPNTCMDWS